MRAVDGVDLTIAAGEFFTLLGPSGSGKTTCLRMIGGFTLPTAGRMLIGGEDVSCRPPYARPVNTVFQDYALFPHMSMRDNVAYSLMVRRRAARPSARAAPTSCWRWCSCRASASAGRRSCRAASASAWRWRAR